MQGHRHYRRHSCSQSGKRLVFLARVGFSSHHPFSRGFSPMLAHKTCFLRCVGVARDVTSHEKQHIIRHIRRFPTLIWFVQYQFCFSPYSPPRSALSAPERVLIVCTTKLNKVRRPLQGAHADSRRTVVCYYKTTARRLRAISHAITISPKSPPLRINVSRSKVPCTMVASSEHCRRHAAGAVSTVLSFSDDGVVQTVLKEIRKGDDDKRTGLKPPLVSLKIK